MQRDRVPAVRRDRSRRSGETRTDCVFLRVRVSRDGRVLSDAGLVRVSVGRFRRERRREVGEVVSLRSVGGWKTSLQLRHGVLRDGSDSVRASARRVRVVRRLDIGIGRVRSPVFRVAGVEVRRAPRSRALSNPRRFGDSSPAGSVLVSKFLRADVGEPEQQTRSVNLRRRHAQVRVRGRVRSRVPVGRVVDDGDRRRERSRDVPDRERRRVGSHGTKKTDGGRGRETDRSSVHEVRVDDAVRADVRVSHGVSITVGRSDAVLLVFRARSRRRARILVRRGREGVRVYGGTRGRSRRGARRRRRRVERERVVRQDHARLQDGSDALRPRESVDSQVHGVQDHRTENRRDTGCSHDTSRFSVQSRSPSLYRRRRGPGNSRVLLGGVQHARRRSSGRVLRSTRGETRRPSRHFRGPRGGRHGVQRRARRVF